MKNFLKPLFPALIIFVLVAAAPILSTVQFPDQPLTTKVISALPHVADNTTLAASSIAQYPNGVWRDDYAAGLGAPPLWFKPESGTCVANSRVNDGGSCVNTTSGGNSWIAVFTAGGVDPLQFGADPTGVSDSTTAFLGCLTATTLYGGQCTVPLAGKYRILGNLTIPASAALVCNHVMPNTPGSNGTAPYGQLGAITVASTKSIFMSSGSSIQGCLIYRDGMTFPAANSSAFAGTAIIIGANQDGSSLINDMIMGFNLGISITTTQHQLLQNLNMDNQNGLTINGTFGFIDIHNLKMWPFATIANFTGSNYSVIQRTGTGIVDNGQGTTYSGYTDIENYAIDVDLSGADTHFERLWTDMAPAADTSGSIGLRTNNGITGQNIWIDNFEGYSSSKPLVVGNTGGTIHFGHMHISLAGTDCITVNSGSLYISDISIEQASVASCTAHVINITNANTITSIAGGVIKDYVTDSPILLPAGVALLNQLSLGQVQFPGLTAHPIVDATFDSGMGEVNSASALAMPAFVDGASFEVLGTTDITSITNCSGGQKFQLVFSGVLTVHNGGNLVMIGAANQVVASQDVMSFLCLGSNFSGGVREIGFAH